MVEPVVLDTKPKANADLVDALAVLLEAAKGGDLQAMVWTEQWADGDTKNDMAGSIIISHAVYNLSAIIHDLHMGEIDDDE